MISNHLSVPFLFWHVVKKIRNAQTCSKGQTSCKTTGFGHCRSSSGSNQEIRLRFYLIMKTLPALLHVSAWSLAFCTCCVSHDLPTEHTIILIAMLAAWLYGWKCQPVHHFDPDWKMSTATVVHGPQRMNPADSGDPLTFSSCGFGWNVSGGFTWNLIQTFMFPSR